MIRDRVGVKPLFYTKRGDTLIFASEIKGLFAYPGVKPDVYKRQLFGSAQTSNLISVFADLAGHPDANFFVRLLGVFIYMFALSLTVILPKFTRLHLPYVSLFIDAMAALIVAFLPSDLNDFIALYPLYFAMAIQWCSFKGGDGSLSSTHLSISFHPTM